MLIACALVAGACGDDDDDDATGTTAAGSDTTAATTAETTGDTSAGPGSDTTAAPSGDDYCTEDRIGGQVTFGAANAISGAVPGTTLGKGVGNTEITAAFDNIMRYDYEAQEFYPHLAESLEPNDDLTEWTLVLRDDVTFGNGDPLTAEAVAFSVERFKTQPVALAASANLVTSMDVVDEHTLVFHLSRPVGQWDYFLSTEIGSPVNPAIVESMTPEEFAAAPPPGSGVGPFIVERFVPGEEYVMRARTDWWGGPVCIETLRFVYIQGGPATLEAYQSGDLNALYLVENEAVGNAQEAGITGFGDRGTIQPMLLINNGRNGTTPPASDVRVRQAIAAAMDLETIAERSTGDASWASGAVFPAEGLEGPGFDPERARSLLEEYMTETGWDGSIRLLCNPTPLQTEASIAIEALLEAVGFNVERENLPLSQLAPRIITEANYDLACWGASIFAEGPMDGLNQYLSTSSTNRAGYVNADSDAALEQMYRARTIEEKQAAAAELQAVWNETVPLVPLMETEYWVGYSDDIHGMDFTRSVTALFDRAYIE